MDAEKDNTIKAKVDPKLKIKKKLKAIEKLLNSKPTQTKRRDLLKAQSSLQQELKKQ